MRAACVTSIVLAGLIGCGGGKPEQAAVDTASVPADPRAAIFVAKGCPQCHAIAGLGVTSPQTAVGPDLTEAYEGVQLRLGVSLAEYLAKPTGTMQVVLTSQVKLTPAERDSMVAVLRGLWEEHEARQGHPVP